MFHLTIPSRIHAPLHCQQLFSFASLWLHIEMHIDSQFANGSLKKCTLTIFNSCKTHYPLPHRSLPRCFSTLLLYDCNLSTSKVAPFKKSIWIFFPSTSLIPLLLLAIFAIHFGCSFEGNHIWIVTFFSFLFSWWYDRVHWEYGVATVYCDWIEVVLRESICWWMRCEVEKVEKDFRESMTTCSWE
jgi:hypothetical protein